MKSFLITLLVGVYTPIIKPHKLLLSMNILLSHENRFGKRAILKDKLI